MSRNEVIYTDLGSLCVPRRNISDVRELFKWNSVPYKTAKHNGNMLVAMRKSHPEDVELKLELTGYYRVFVGLPTYGDNIVKIRLSGEAEWMEVVPFGRSGFGGHNVFLGLS